MAASEIQYRLWTSTDTYKIEGAHDPYFIGFTDVPQEKKKTSMPYILPLQGRGFTEWGDKNKIKGGDNRELICVKRYGFCEIEVNLARFNNQRKGIKRLSNTRPSGTHSRFGMVGCPMGLADQRFMLFCIKFIRIPIERNSHMPAPVDIGKKMISFVNNKPFCFFVI
jgi:hypothetical protein